MRDRVLTRFRGKSAVYDVSKSILVEAVWRRTKVLESLARPQRCDRLSKSVQLALTGGTSAHMPRSDRIALTEDIRHERFGHWTGHVGGSWSL